MRLPLLVLAAICSSHAIVNFSHSTLYDRYDFISGQEVRLPKCDFGCHIFAVTDEATYGHPCRFLPKFAEYLYIHDNTNNNFMISIRTLAENIEKGKMIKPWIIEGPANISVVTISPPENVKAPFLVLYVIDKQIADTISYEVYDVAKVVGVDLNPNSDVVTFLSTAPYNLMAPSSVEENKVTVRLAGFDNAHDDNKDGCPMAYQTEGNIFPGFFLQQSAPILSLAFNKRNLLTIQPNRESRNTETWSRFFAVDGFLNSLGWNGCANPHSGGIQTFRYYDTENSHLDSYLYSDTFRIYAEQTRNIQMTVMSNFDSAHRLTINENGHSTEIGDTNLTDVNFDSKDLVTVSFNNMMGDQGFLLRYKSTIAQKVPELD